MILGARPRIRPPGNDFIPTLDSLIIGWYKHDAITATGSNQVITCIDKGPRGNDLVRGSGASDGTAPVYNASGGPNGKPYLQHSALGAAGTMVITGLTAEPVPIHVFMACKPMTTPTGSVTWLDGHASNTLRLLANLTGAVRAFSTGGGTVSASSTLNAWQLNEAIFAGGSSGKMRVNDAAAATGNVGTASITGLTVGAVAGGSFSADVAWSELLITEALTSEQITSVRAELNAQYALW